MKAQFSTKAAIIAMLALALVGLLAFAIWVYPPLLMYGMLAVTGLVAYVAVYFLVLSSMRRQRESKRVQQGAVEAEIVKSDLS